MVGYLYIVQLQISYNVYVPKIITVGWQLKCYCNNEQLTFWPNLYIDTVRLGPWAVCTIIPLSHYVYVSRSTV